MQAREARAACGNTCVVDTGSGNWMAPFAEHLGIDPSEFSNWRPVFSAYRSKVLLVEGDIDKRYFEALQANSYEIEGLNKEIEVVPYGGKDTLKNTLLLQFVLNKFDDVFITYDLDADKDARNALGRLGLRPVQTHFIPLGIQQPGKDCVEGLLPSRLATVNGRETDLVMKLSSAERRERSQKLYLEEFNKHTDYSKDELKELAKW